MNLTMKAQQVDMSEIPVAPRRQEISEFSAQHPLRQQVHTSVNTTV